MNLKKASLNKISFKMICPHMRLNTKPHGLSHEFALRGLEASRELCLERGLRISVFEPEINQLLLKVF